MVALLAAIRLAFAAVGGNLRIRRTKDCIILTFSKGRVNRVQSVEAVRICVVGKRQ
jgi:hypothetical protein